LLRGGPPASPSPQNSLTDRHLVTRLELCLCWRSSGAEQLPCKQWVGGSNPPASASFEDASWLVRFLIAIPPRSGRYPSGQRGQTVNLLAYAFGGSNPPLPTIVATGGCTDRSVGGLFEVGVAPTRATTAMVEVTCGNSSAVERQPSKLGVAGSNPVSRSTRIRRAHGFAGAQERWGLGGHVGAPMKIERAHVAQSAERVLGKDEVSGSNPDMGSSIRATVSAPVDGR
jgi:hypothetical protein